MALDHKADSDKVKFVRDAVLAEIGYWKIAGSICTRYRMAGAGGWNSDPALAPNGGL